jgi:hypothetical protein
VQWLILLTGFGSVLIGVGSDDPALSRTFYVIAAVSFGWTLLAYALVAWARYRRREPKAPALTPPDQ